MAGSDLIRKARVQDVRAIHRLLQDFAVEGKLLPRPLSALYDHLRDYAVAVDPETGLVTGCCALQICWEDMAEVRSLAVARDYWGKGIGNRLLEWALKEAEEYGITRVFALTYEPEFFERYGFMEVDKAELPQKIWQDCLN
ncbi:MAG: N-acetyltransferase, partial [Deltaproteobacteria bacterium]|nr:N-acetyltransferase [Deltaproteobacteria bacterium]